MPDGRSVIIHRRSQTADRSASTPVQACSVACSLVASSAPALAPTVWPSLKVFLSNSLSVSLFLSISLNDWMKKLKWNLWFRTSLSESLYSLTLIAYLFWSHSFIGWFLLFLFFFFFFFFFCLFKFVFILSFLLVSVLVFSVNQHY